MSEANRNLLLARLALKGIPISLAARALYLSEGALYKKLRGVKPLLSEELQALEALLSREEDPTD